MRQRTNRTLADCLPAQGLRNREKVTNLQCDFAFFADNSAQKRREQRLLWFLGCQNEGGSCQGFSACATIRIGDCLECLMEYSLRISSHEHEIEKASCQSTMLKSRSRFNLIRSPSLMSSRIMGNGQCGRLG